MKEDTKAFKNAVFIKAGLIAGFKSSGMVSGAFLI